MSETPKKRKTYTSSKVKNAWNKKHYKAITFQVSIELADQFREKLKENNDIQTDVFRNAMIEYIKNH